MDKHSASPIPVPSPSPVSASEAKVIHEVTSEESEDSSCDETDFESEDASYDETEEAIESDSDEEWEDVDSEDNKPWENEVFQRIDSKLNLISKCSQLTTLMQKSDRASALQNTASSSTSVVHQPLALNGSIDHPSRISQGLLQLSITTTSDIYSQVLSSSYITRHSMFATELTESLRNGLLRERLDKRRTFDAVKGRPNPHPHDIKDLQNSPSDTEGFSHHFEEGYHQRGW